MKVHVDGPHPASSTPTKTARAFQTIGPLDDNVSTTRFEATLSAADLTGLGTYNILYRAVGHDGLGVDFYGEPATGTMVHTTNVARPGLVICQ